MNPEQALQLLDGLTAQINMSRQQHAQVIVAVRTLQQAIAPQISEIPLTLLGSQTDGCE